MDDPGLDKIIQELEFKCYMLKKGLMTKELEQLVTRLKKLR